MVFDLKSTERFTNRAVPEGPSQKRGNVINPPLFDGQRIIQNHKEVHYG